MAILPPRPLRGSGKAAQTAFKPAKRDGNSFIHRVNHFSNSLGIPKISRCPLLLELLVLLDFFPATAGRRSGAFVPGERFGAELAFYPAQAPLRAVIARRDQSSHAPEVWPDAAADPFADLAEQALAAPWRIEMPVLLPEGRLCAEASGRAWWRSLDGVLVPVRKPLPPLSLGARIERAAGVWDGARLALIAARTNWGRLGFDA